MLIDITLPLTQQMLRDGMNNPRRDLIGHAGTHFDVMDKEFPLAYTERKGIVFDVSGVWRRDIEVSDIDLDLVEKDMFVAFCSGYIQRVGYGEGPYFKEHPQLSVALIDALLEKGISIIGLDFAGVRRGAEHTPTDQRCAERGVFVVENLWGLHTLLEKGGRFTACTYPMSIVDVTGQPCRVIAKI